MIKKNILIFGGLGFIGRNLVNNLYKRNKIYIFDKKLLNKKPYHQNIKVIKSNLDDLQKYSRLLKKIDYIFHLAGYVGKDLKLKESQLIIKEIKIFHSLSKVLKKNQKIKIIYASSCQVYGINNKSNKAKETDPLLANTSYGIAKIIAEFFLKDLSRRYSIPIICLRFFNVYGPGQNNVMAIPNFVDKAKKNKRITIHGNGLQIRDFLYIDDCIKVIIKAAKKINNFEIINVPGAESINIKNLVKLIINLTKSNSKVTYQKIELESQILKSVGHTKKLLSLIKFKPAVRLKNGILRVINE